jgi:hypothetical protein
VLSELQKYKKGAGAPSDIPWTKEYLINI